MPAARKKTRTPPARSTRRKAVLRAGSLQARLQQAETALLRAQAEARAAVAIRNHVVSTLAHDLRTPLTGLLVWARLLNQPKAMDPEHLREGLAAIEQCAAEQQAMIDAILDTSRILAGKVQLEPADVDLPALARTALTAIRPAALEKEIELEEALDASAGRVRADARRLQQILAHLLGNAVKFTPPKGRVALRLTRRGRRVEIRISDTGRGLARADLDRIFEPFTQVGNPEPETKALGLGLAIARQLAELHDGTLTAASAGPGRGAVFTLRLPAAASESQPSSRQR